MKEMGASPILHLAFSMNSSTITHVKNRELFQNGTKLLFKGVLSELDLPHIEITDPTNFIVFVYDLVQIPCERE